MLIFQFTSSVFVTRNQYNTNSVFLSLLGSSARAQQVAKETSMDSHGEVKNKKPKEPKWLLILEVVTGAVVLIFLTFCVAAIFKRCKPKSSVIRPWKRSTTWKDQITISIG